MKSIGIVLAVCILVLLSSYSFAQSNPSGTKTPVIDKRERIQQKRIDNGIKSGELTKREANKLERKSNKLKFEEAKAKFDGKVTAFERKKLSREENQLSKDIYRKKHNKRQRKL